MEDDSVLVAADEDIDVWLNIQEARNAPADSDIFYPKIVSSNYKGFIGPSENSPLLSSQARDRDSNEQHEDSDLGALPWHKRPSVSSKV
jgi:hypothetical protein